MSLRDRFQPVGAVANSSASNLKESLPLLEAEESSSSGETEEVDTVTGTGLDDDDYCDIQVRTSKSHEGVAPASNISPKSIKSTTQATMAVLMFLFVGPCLILLNNYILKHLRYNRPILLSSVGMAVSALIVHYLAHFTRYVHIRPQIRKLVTLDFFIRKIMIIAFLQALTLSFGNNAYLFVSISLVSMMKSFTPVLTMAVSFLFDYVCFEDDDSGELEAIRSKREYRNSHMIASIVVLSLGTAITSTGVSRTDASLVGFVCMLSAQSIEAMKLMMSQSLMQSVAVKKAPKLTPKNAVEKTDAISANSVSSVTKKKKMKMSTTSKSDYISKASHSQSIEMTAAKKTADAKSQELSGSGQKGKNREISVLRKAKDSSSELKASSTGQSIERVSFSVWESLYFYAPTATLWLIVFSVICGEWNDFADLWRVVTEHIHFFALAGCLGFCANLSAWLITGLISGLYLKALGVFRNSCFVILNVLVFGEVVTSQQLLGYVVSLAGFGYYNYVKFKAKGTHSGPRN